MKQREFEKCIGCHRGVAAAGIHFYRVEIEQFILDAHAIQRQAGLEMAVGSAFLAAVLGPDEDLAVSVSKQHALLCADCALGLSVAAVLDRAGSDEAEKPAEARHDS